MLSTWLERFDNLEAPNPPISHHSSMVYIETNLFAVNPSTHPQTVHVIGIWLKIFCSKTLSNLHQTWKMYY